MDKSTNLHKESTHTPSPGTLRGTRPGRPPPSQLDQPPRPSAPTHCYTGLPWRTSAAAPGSWTAAPQGCFCRGPQPGPSPPASSGPRTSSWSHTCTPGNGLSTGSGAGRRHGAAQGCGGAGPAMRGGGVRARPSRRKLRRGRGGTIGACPGAGRWNRCRGPARGGGAGPLSPTGGWGRGPGVGSGGGAGLPPPPSWVFRLTARGRGTRGAGTAAGGGQKGAERGRRRDPGGPPPP